MATKYEVTSDYEKLIHNDLTNCAHSLRKMMHGKLQSDDRTGVSHLMMASLAFTAFSTEAVVNFVGWKLLKGEWPERKSFWKKVDLLIKTLELELSWDARPLSTLGHLHDSFRNKIAHGQPDAQSVTDLFDETPDIFDSLKGEWEEWLSAEHVDTCYEDLKAVEQLLIAKAEIPGTELLSHASQSVKVVSA